MRTKLLLFDLMGTLLFHTEDDKPYWYRLGEVVESAGIMTSERFNEIYSGWRERRGPRGTHEITLRDRLKELIPELSSRCELLDDLINVYMLDYEIKTVPCEGVQEMLSAWIEIAKIGVVSNFFVTGFPERLLKRHKLFSHVDFVIDSSQVGFRKPAPEIYIAALVKAGFDKSNASQAVFIGDDYIADIEGPNKLGMSTFLYSDSQSHINGVPVICSWNDFRP